jgi:hypothetical protein
MLLFGRLIYFVLQHAERGNQARPRFSGLDYVIDITTLGRNEWVGEALPKFFGLGGEDCVALGQ